MDERCYWVREKGQRFFIPVCWGAVINGPDGCYCPAREVLTEEKQRIKSLEKRVRELELRLKATNNDRGCVMGFEVYSIGLCYCSVCTDLTDVAEIEREVNRLHPTGVAPWKLADEPFKDGSPNPCQCSSRPGNGHYLLSC